ncbi:MAG: 50S ribosomal protein L4 [Phycisphaerae bacterium]
MLVVPVFNVQGEPAGECQVDAASLGGRVRPRLIKQAIVAFLDHQRRDSARTKGRAHVVGSTRKLYRQKGTGNARVGNIRTPIRRGGGRTFAKRGPRATRILPKKMRRLACHSAILAKIQSSDCLILDDFTCPQIKTKTVASVLAAVGADRGCTLAMHQRDDNTYRSTRNIPKTAVCTIDDLNAYDVLARRKLVFTRPAFDRLVERTGGAGGTSGTGGAAVSD